MRQVTILIGLAGLEAHPAAARGQAKLMQGATICTSKLPTLAKRTTQPFSQLVPLWALAHI